MYKGPIKETVSVHDYVSDASQPAALSDASSGCAVNSQRLFTSERCAADERAPSRDASFK
jgi:hypothetical protein